MEFPSGSMKIPSGSSSPRAMATMTFPRAQTEVAMSSTIGGSSPLGIAKHSGLVPSCLDLPPKGAT